MDWATNKQIRFWIIENRSKFTFFLEQDIERENLPLNLLPTTIDINLLADHLNGKNPIIGHPLYLNYTHIFPYLSIELTNSYEYKVFLMFFRLSFFHCPTQEEWDIYRADEINIDALKKESIDKISENTSNVYYPI